MALLLLITAAPLLIGRALTRFRACVLEDEETGPGAVYRIRQAAMIDVHVVHLDRDWLSFADGIGVLVGLGNVEPDFLEVIRIAEINDSDTGVEVRDPRDLDFEPIEFAVDRFCRLVRPEAAAL